MYVYYYGETKRLNQIPKRWGQSFEKNVPKIFNDTINSKECGENGKIGKQTEKNQFNSIQSDIIIRNLQTYGLLHLRAFATHFLS